MGKIDSYFQCMLVKYGNKECFPISLILSNEHSPNTLNARLSKEDYYPKLSVYKGLDKIH